MLLARLSFLRSDSCGGTLEGWNAIQHMKKNAHFKDLVLVPTFTIDPDLLTTPPPFSSCSTTTECITALAKEQSDINMFDHSQRTLNRIIITPCFSRRLYEANRPYDYGHGFATTRTLR